jgi:hypothetical protein
MSQQSTYSRLIGLIFIVTAITIADSYIPHELTLAREIVSYAILAIMAVIVAVTVRALLRDF